MDNSNNQALTVPKSYSLIEHAKGLTHRELALKLHSRFLSHIEHYKPQFDTLSFAHHNAQSLLTKIDYYQSIKLQRFDIISISETWLNPKIPNSLVRIPEFEVLRSDRTDTSKRRGGGALLFIKKSLAYKALPSLAPPPGSKFDAIWALVQEKRGSNLIVGSIYLPPNLTASNVTEFLMYLSTTLEDSIFNKSNTLMLGDFNCNWNSPSTLKSNIEQLCDQHNLSMSIRGPTYVSTKYGTESQLDLCFTSKQLTTVHAKVLITEISDHYALAGCVKMRPKRMAHVLISVKNYKKKS